MVKSNIPKAYLIFLEKLKEHCQLNVLPLNRARHILSNIFRIPKASVAPILGEMHRMGLIKINGQRFDQKDKLVEQ